MEKFKAKAKSAYVSDPMGIDDPEPTFEILVCVACGCEQIDDADDGAGPAAKITLVCRGCGASETVINESWYHDAEELRS